MQIHQTSQLLYNLEVYSEFPLKYTEMCYMFETGRVMSTLYVLTGVQRDFNPLFNVGLIGNNLSKAKT